MSDIFVSYKSEDRRRVRSLVEALEADGYSVWWDEQIGGGAAWRHAIEAELNSAKCVIVVWSRRSVGPEGEFVQDEATRAKQRQVYIPIAIDKVALPLGFGEAQALPLTGWRGNRSDRRYQKVLGAVQHITGSEKAGRAVPTAVWLDRRAVIAGGTLAAAVTAGAAGWKSLTSRVNTAGADSIAVLPFANLSGDDSKAYIADGITEELRNALARIGGLAVTGRMSSQAVRDHDLKTVAMKLGVANVLTGSVRESSSTIRVATQLAEGRNGIELWSASYDRPPGDVIKIQTDIAESVATALNPLLRTAARAALSVGGTQNPEAQRLLWQLKALESRELPLEALIREAIKLIDRAIELDPRYALAYAIKALALIEFANSVAQNAGEMATARAEAVQIARIGLTIAPRLPDGHWALSRAYTHNLEFGPGFAELERAMGLAPGDAFYTLQYSMLTSLMGDSARALRLSQKAIDLDPFHPAPYNAKVYNLYAARRFHEAISYAQQLERETPERFNSELEVAQAFILLGKFAEARSYIEREKTHSGSRLTREALLLARSGNAREAQEILEALKQEHGEPWSYQYGQICAQLGDHAQALQHLEHGFAIKDAGLTSAKVDPFLDPLRSKTQFASLLAKLKFPA